MFSCPYCHKTCKTKRGVTQHINQSPPCLLEQEQEISSARTITNRLRKEANPEPVVAAGTRRSVRLQVNQEHEHDSQRQAPPLERLLDADPPADDGDFFPDGDDASQQDTNTQAPIRHKKVGDEMDTASYSSTSLAGLDQEAEDTKKPPPNRQILEDFRAYCEQHHDNFLRLTKEEKTSIKLMDVLRRKAPLNAYATVLEWHLKETGVLKEHERLGDSEKFQHRKTLMKHLLTRYNLNPMMPKEKKVRLPSSKAVVSIPYRDAADCLVSLLTDPRFEDEDYLFFHDDPLAHPPEQITYLEDLNTGDAYLKSHERMITHKRQCLLAVPIYIDGANTGQFNDLPVTAVKIALGIHKRQTRDRDYAWRELGFVPVVRKDPARGKKIFQQTGHLEAQDVIVLEGEGDATLPKEEEEDEDEDEEQEEAVKAQDFHTMLSAILQSFVELQRTGFIWDLVYKGKLYRNVEFVIFVPFVKCDSEEGDLLCGKFTVRTQNVKHVCRYCHCPTNKADDPRVKYKLKTQAEIQALVDREDLEGLKGISQQYIQNAWYDVTFHKANACGIHGACPSEKLHAIQLGVFKYLREIFFVQMGKSSQLAEDINGLATMYGKLLTRQSERDLPNTNFAKGIQKGKLMARDF